MTTSRLEIVGGVPLRGRVRVPGDKSVSHRALLLAARAEGLSRISGLPASDDVSRSARGVEMLGAEIDGTPGAGDVSIMGGPGRLAEPRSAIDVGNSGTSMRLLAGFVAPFGWLTRLEGDESLSRRPMDRVAEPLGMMGAVVEGRGGRCLPPLCVRGGRLVGIDFAPSVASAQVKSAVLLAGLGAEGETVVREQVGTRVHTEEMLAAFGADITVVQNGLGRVVRLRPSPVQPFELEVPGDPSAAAFWVVAGCTVPGSEVLVEGVYLGPGRAGFLDVLDRMGADVEVIRRGPRTADLVACQRALQGTEVAGPEVPSLIDEIPVLAVAGAAAEGTTTFRDAGELSVKETNRLETTARELAAFGIGVETFGDGLAVHGGNFVPGRARSHGDHRIAMAMAVAGLAAHGTTTVSGWEAVATSYPDFAADIPKLQGRL